MSLIEVKVLFSGCVNNFETKFDQLGSKQTRLMNYLKFIKSFGGKIVVLFKNYKLIKETYFFSFFLTDENY